SVRSSVTLSSSNRLTRGRLRAVMTMRDLMKSSPVLAILAVIVAYPWAVVTVPILVIGMIRNPEPTMMLVVVLVAVILGARIVVPGLVRFVVRVQRAWTRLVFEVWKLIETKRTIKQSEKRMRETVVNESRPVQDLGGDLDAS